MPVSATNELSSQRDLHYLEIAKRVHFPPLTFFLFILNYIAVFDTASRTQRSYFGSACKQYFSLNPFLPCGHSSCPPDVALIGSFHVSLDVKFRSIPLDIKASIIAFSLPHSRTHHLSPVWKSYSLYLPSQALSSMPYNNQPISPQQDLTGTSVLPRKSSSENTRSRPELRLTFHVAVARVKKIIAMDEDIAQCSNSAAFAISIATVSILQILPFPTDEDV